MADRYLIETSAVDGFLLENGTGVLLLETPSAYATAVLADSPAGYWRVGEGSGTVANDSATSPHNGTYTGTPTLGVAGAVADGDTAVQAERLVPIRHRAEHSGPPTRERPVDDGVLGEVDLDPNRDPVVHDDVRVGR